MDPVHDRGSMDPVHESGPWIPGPCFVLTHAQETFVCLRSLILSFTCNFFAYFKFHSD